MLRLLHRWPGLIAALFVSILGISGAVLSVFPALDAVTMPTNTAATVADLAGRIVAANPDVTEIDRAPSGAITAYLDSTGPVAQAIDPSTGASLGPVTHSAFYDWVVELHRSLFLSDGGRIGVAVAAVAMLLLAVSGLVMLARRSGGWRKVFAPQLGKGWVHAALARATVLGLILSAVTALWMTAVTFELVPQSQAPAFPAAVSGQTGFDLTKSTTLQSMPVAALDQLVFPMAGDPTDVYTLKTSGGQGFVDQGNGQILAWADASVWDQVTRLLTSLHTGRGAAWLGLILGLSALGVPVLSWTGARQYLSRRGRKAVHSIAANKAEVVVLVGSEGGTTWGFAETLRSELAGKGLAVHVTSLANFAPDAWPKAELALILAATYGAGEAPEAAAGFLDRLRALPHAPKIPMAVLGFGDRSFPDFCAYAGQIATTAAEIGWEQALPMATVDRQSPQDFARWGQALSGAIGMDIVLHHAPEVPANIALTLVSRRDFGEAVQAPTAILRFALPKTSLFQRIFGHGPRFQAGDLVGILPEGQALPRFYSLASSDKDGFVEICVRKHPGGICSSMLTGLDVGAVVHGFLRQNPGFHMLKSKAPVILIGAGTGIGPLAGFARANDAKRPLHLFFGMRHPSSDLLYGSELEGWLNTGHLATIRAAFSRGAPKTYVQDELRRDRVRLTQLVADGARIMVCGGRDMAAGVRAALEDVLAPMGLTPAMLKAEGRYAEDVY